MLDDERFARGDRENPHHRNAESLGHAAVAVGHQGEGQVVLILEMFLGIDRVAADADDVKALRMQFGVGIA